VQIKIEVEDTRPYGELVHGIVAVAIGQSWVPNENWYDSLDQVLDAWLQTNESLLCGAEWAEYIFFGSEYSVIVQAAPSGRYDVFKSWHAPDGSRLKGDLIERISKADYWAEVCRAFQSIPEPLLAKFGIKTRVDKICKAAA